MKCAVQLVFSEKDQRKINDLREMLVKNGVHDDAVPINHVSLADIEIDESQVADVGEFLKTFSRTHEQIKLVLGFAGSFMTNENVLFLAPTMTEDLLRYNEELLVGLKKIGIESGKYYTKNNWQPHCTLAIRLSDEELFEGFKLIKNSKVLPFEVLVDGIDLLRYEPRPFKEVMSFNLQKQKEGFLEK